MESFMGNFMFGNLSFMGSSNSSSGMHYLEYTRQWIN